jgi:hypothetical protein
LSEFSAAQLAREWNQDLRWLVEDGYWLPRLALFSREESGARPYRAATAKQDQERDRNRADAEAARARWRAVHAADDGSAPPPEASGPRAI